MRHLAALALVGLLVLSGGPARGATLPRDPDRDSPWSWEPGLAQAANGTLYVIGNHCALVDQHGTCQLDQSRSAAPDYTPLWRSRDGGRTYTYLADPLKLLEQGAADAVARGGEAGQDHPGGYDTDVAVAPIARPHRPPLLYAVSAWDVSSTLAVSADGGRTWRVAGFGGTVPLQDRPWLATSGPCDLYLQYHAITGSQNIASVPTVERYDGCAIAGGAPATPITSTLVEPAANQVTAGDQVMAKLAVAGNTVYLAERQCDTFTTNLDCNAPGELQSMHVFISRARGAHFADTALPDAHVGGALNDGTWPSALGADDRGHMAVAATDTHHIVLWTSQSSGRRWRLRKGTLDAPLGWAQAMVPTAAVHGESIAVSWYGSPPARAPAPQRWFELVARSDDDGRHFRITRLPQTLASTENGTSLGDALYDDNGLAFTRRGDLALVYSQSCAGHSPADRACPPVPGGAQANALTIRSAWVKRCARARPRTPRGGSGGTCRRGAPS